MKPHRISGAVFAVEGIIMDQEQNVREYVYDNVTVCELLFGQPEEYYRQMVEQKKMIPINTDKYHVLISGLCRQVYRPYFGINAFNYTDYFREVNKEIDDMINAQHVQSLSTMLLYDHSKRFAMIFSTPENVSAHDVAEIVSSCFNRLYARIFDMSKTPYRNYTVLSEEIHGYDKLTKTFREIDALSRQQYFDMRTMVMTPGLLESVRVCVDPEQIHEDLIKMYVAMRAGEMGEMIEKYHLVMAQLEKARDFALLEDTLASMRRTLEGLLRSHGMEPDSCCREVFAIEHHPTFQLQRDAIETYLTQSLARLGDTRPMSHLIQEAVRYIRHHYAEDIAVSDIAEHIGMSQSWLTKRFKQECGVNIVGYLLDVRIQRAKAMLAQTDMLIMEIACATGFENPGYFISVFRRAVGMTPKAYRDQAQEKKHSQP